MDKTGHSIFEDLGRLGWPVAQDRVKLMLQAIHPLVQSLPVGSEKLEKWVETFVEKYEGYFDRAIYLTLLNIALTLDESRVGDREPRLFDEIFEKLVSHTNFRHTTGQEGEDSRIRCVTKLLRTSSNPNEIMVLLTARGDWAIEVLSASVEKAGTLERKPKKPNGDSKKKQPPLSVIKGLACNAELESKIASWSIGEMGALLLGDHKRKKEFWHVLNALEVDCIRRIDEAPGDLGQVAQIGAIFSAARLRPATLFEKIAEILKRNLNDLISEPLESERLSVCRDDIVTIYHSLWEQRCNDPAVDSLILEATCSGKLCLSSSAVTKLLWCFCEAHSTDDFRDAWDWAEVYFSAKVPQNFETKVVGALMGTLEVERYPTYPASKRKKEVWDLTVVKAISEVLEELDPTAKIEQEKCIGPFRVDIFLTFSNGAIGAVELDGLRYHYPNGNPGNGLIGNDIVRQRFLEKVMGVPVQRINSGWPRLSVNAQRDVIEGVIRKFALEGPG